MAQSSLPELFLVFFLPSTSLRLLRALVNFHNCCCPDQDVSSYGSTYSPTAMISAARSIPSSSP
jgi:hypothetical protein